MTGFARSLSSQKTGRRSAKRSILAGQSPSTRWSFITIKELDKKLKRVEAEARDAFKEIEDGSEHNPSSADLSAILSQELNQLCTSGHLLIYQALRFTPHSGDYLKGKDSTKIVNICLFIR